MKIFAYGSNLCTERLRRRVPSAEYLGRARLDGYELRFHKRSFCDASGKANVYRTGNAADCVWGAVFECADCDKPLLDRAEGLGKGYNEERLTVVMDDGREESAFAYVADPSAIDESLVPFTWYLRYVIDGAEERGLPAEYRAWLETHEGEPDPEPERERRNTLVPA